MRRFVVLLVLAGTLVSRSAEADGGEMSAAALFEEARAAFANKDFATAARKFEEANQTSPRGQAVYNAALSWEPAGEPARAADDYALALEDASLPAAAQENARARLAQLERSLLTLRIDAAEPGTVSVAHADGRRLPATIHLPRGHHEISVRFDDGRDVRQPIDAAPGERVTLKVVPGGAVAVPVPLAAAAAPMRPTAEAPSGQRTFAWVVFGAAAAAVAGALVLGSFGLDARDRFDASQRLDRDARDDAIAFRTWANVSWGAAAVFALTGGVLFFTAPKAASR